MSMIHLELTGGESLQVDIGKLHVGLSDLRPFWRLLYPTVQGWIRENFQTQGQTFENPWPPLSRGYASAKLRRWGDRPLLVASGDLRKAVYKPRHTATRETLDVWIDESDNTHHGPIAQFHQEGTDRMPARPLLYTALPPALEPELHEVADQYIDGLLKWSAR